MLVRGVLAAAIGTVLRHSSWDSKGKAAATTMLPTGSQKNYGSTGAGAAGRPMRRTSTLSASRSGDRLGVVPEQVNDSPYDGDRARLAWDGLEENGDEWDREEEDDGLAHYNYERAWRLYSIVPIGAALLLLFTALLPQILSPDPLPTSPSATRLVLFVILSSSLWCLGHSIRVPLFSILNMILSGLVSFISALSCSRCRRTGLRATAADILAAFTSVTHVLLMAFLQESLRVASFAILDLHWHQSDDLVSPVLRPRARDAAFHEVWTLALGWALAEVFAGVIQGYEQLALYADTDTPFRRTSASSSKSGNDDVPLDGGNSSAVLDEEAVDLMRWSMPCVGTTDDDDIEGANSAKQAEIDSALLRLANLRARDELEDLYGQPYFEIPVFVVLLQRLDSILLALGNTLLLSAAFLPRPPDASSLSLFSHPPPFSPPASPLNHPPPPLHTHMLPLISTFFIVSLTHAALGVLHAPPVLSRVGLPAAAYTSCIIGLGLTFAGIGVWIGLW